VSVPRPDPIVTLPLAVASGAVRSMKNF